MGTAHVANVGYYRLRFLIYSYLAMRQDSALGVSEFLTPHVRLYRWCVAKRGCLGVNSEIATAYVVEETT